MRYWNFIIFVLIALFGLFPASGTTKSEEDFAGKVVVIPIGEESLTNSQSFGFMNRILKRASDEKAAAIVFELNTPGGLAWETSELMMKGLYPMKIPTFAFVNPKAMSAGALIAAACDSIYMAPASSIGAAGIVTSTGEEMDPVMRKKVESAFSAFTRSVVEEKKHNTELIKAMMIPASKDETYGPVKLGKGELLTLTGKEAISPGTDGKPLLAKGIVSDVKELLAKENITAPVMTAVPTGFERIALWIAWASPFLILIGMGAAYIEMKTPGFGIAGAIAVIAFALFFFGNHIAGNLAGYETAALFVLGCILLLVEIFLIPGTFISGLLGTILIVAALFGGMVSLADLESLMRSGDFTMDAIVSISLLPLAKLAVGMAGGMFLILLLMRYLPDSFLFRSFSNNSVSGGREAGAAVGTSATGASIGALGETVTELKPNGKALIHGQIYEVCSRQGLLIKGTPVRVIEKRAFDLIVERAEIPSPEPEDNDNKTEQ